MTAGSNAERLVDGDELKLPNRGEEWSGRLALAVRDNAAAVAVCASLMDSTSGAARALVYGVPTVIDPRVPTGFVWLVDAQYDHPIAMMRIAQ